MSIKSKDSIVGGIIRFYIPSIVSFALGLLSAIVLTRVFSPDTYGVLNIFNNTSALILSIAYLGMDSAYIRFYNEPPENISRTELCFSLMTISLLFLTVCGFTVSLFFFNSFSTRVFGFSSRTICVILFANCFAQIIIRFFLLTYRMRLDTKLYSVVTIFAQIATKFCVVLAALVSDNIIAVMAFNSMGVLAMAIVMLALLGNTVFEFNKRLKIDGSVIKYGILDAPSPILLQLNLFLMQQIIKGRFGMNAVGVYSSANYFVTIFGVLQSGFATYWSAYVYAKYDSNQKTIQKVHDYLLLAVIVVYACLIFFRDIAYLMIGEEYHGSKDFFALILFYPVMLLLSETTVSGIHIAKKNQISLVINIITVCINLLLSYLLSSTLGLKGIALSYGISGIVYYCMSSVMGQKYYKSILSPFKSILGLCILLFMFASSFVFTGKYLYFASGMALVGTTILYRNELNEIAVRIFKKAVDDDKN